MAKSKSYVEEKMKERVRTAGTWLQRGMEEAPDPIEVLLKDPDAYMKALIEGLQDALKRGSWKIGLEKAKRRNKWKGAIPRAGAHYEEVADDMTKNALEDYDARMDCVEKAKKAIEALPKATRAQRIARSQKYLDEVGKCFDALYGRK
jgi:hypothetical protein